MFWKRVGIEYSTIIEIQKFVWFMPSSYFFSVYHFVLGSFLGSEPFYFLVTVTCGDN